MHPHARALRQFGPCIAAILACAASACGSTAEAPSDAAPADVGSDAPRDAMRPDTAVEHVPMVPRCPPGDAGVDSGVDGDVPETGTDSDAADEGGVPLWYPPVQVVNSGGRVLRSPRVVPITFAGNSNRDDIEDFVASFGCTAYWRAVSAEYGILDAVGGAPVHLTESAPAVIDDTAIAKWLRANIVAKTAGWELPTADTIYAIYYPSSTIVSLRGSQSCQQFGGYHQSFNLGGVGLVAYAVIVDCGDTIDGITGTSSHEFIEAATDPSPNVAPTYQRVDDDHVVYSFRAGGEVGDLCAEQDGRGMFTPSDYPFMVQRSWSNLASRTGHDPCVPAASAVYFNTVPVLRDTVAFFTETKGVRIPVGGMAVISLKLFSDGPMDAWNVQAKDISGGPAHLTFLLDKTTGKSGDVIALTIRKNSENSALGAEPFQIISTNGKRRNYSYGLVGH